MYSYRAYGVNIRSALQFPELAPSRATAEVVIRLGKVDPPPSRITQEGRFWGTSEEASFFWEEAAAFSVRAGREIVVDPIPGAEEGLLRLCILGPVLAILLHQRGQLLLHGSAIALAGQAIAFIGYKGWGKSTIAAALHARGHGILTDDLLAISGSGRKCPVVLPGFAQLKLWPETVAALGEPVDTLPRIDPRWEKRALSVDHGFHESLLPLKRIYVLAEGAAHSIEALDAQSALLELVRHSYGIRWLQPVEPTSHLIRCADVVNRVDMRRLKIQQSLATLPSLVRLVEAHETVCDERRTDGARPLAN